MEGLTALQEDEKWNSHSTTETSSQQLLKICNYMNRPLIYLCKNRRIIATVELFE